MNSPQTNPETRIPETRIDGALDVLRHAQPRPGLEPRILHALESRQAHTPSLFAFLHLPSFRLPLWTTAAALALIALAAFLLYRPTPKPHTITLATSTPGASADLSPLTTPASTDEASAAAHPVLSSRAKRAAISSSRLSSELSSRPKAAPLAAAAERPADRTTTKSLTPEEAADLADLHAPSHPAPPLPLTPQEKALLHVLHRGNTTQLAELAALNPEVSAARDAQEAAAFHAFFPDPPPTPQPTGDTE